MLDLNCGVLLWVDSVDDKIPFHEYSKGTIDGDTAIVLCELRRGKEGVRFVAACIRKEQEYYKGITNHIKNVISEGDMQVGTD
jgi:hypothetical protein